MAFDLNNIVEINDGDFKEIDKQLKLWKTVIAALQNGELLKESLKNEQMTNGFYKIKFKESKKNCRICGCGKPADTLVYLWR